MDDGELARYAERLVLHVETTGADVTPQPELQFARRQGLARVEVRAELPGAGLPRQSRIELREIWRRGDRNDWELDGYAYDLIDHERRRRRAFHLHDRDFFIRRYRTVVHEHCEEEIGSADCAHFAGTPIRDGHDAIDRLLDVWTDDAALGCADLECLD